MKHRRWTQAEDALLIEHYATRPTCELAEQLRRTEAAVREHARKTLGLTKDYEALGKPPISECNNDPRTGRFVAGTTPWNKGKHYRAGGRSAETRFRKGNRSHNSAPLGAERLSKDGILQRKISETGYPPRDWQSVHALLWAEHHGPIPQGHVVVFRNGDRRDIRLENLECIPRRELMARNTVHQLPKPIARAVQLRGALVRQINRRTRNGS